MRKLHLADLYPDVKKRITDYLCATDAITFGQTCKIIHHDLDLKILIDDYSYGRSIQQKHMFRPLDYHEGEQEKIWFRFFPIVLPNPIHTIQFTCTFKDQGWGNRKGRIYIREDKNENNYKGDIIAESQLVDHEETEVFLEFRPEPEKKYTMCYVIGGGGGHELYIMYAQVKTLFYHNNGIVDAANILRKRDIVPVRDSNFGVSMLIGVIDRLIQDNNMNSDEQNTENTEIDPLASTFESVGMDPYNNDKLKAMKNFLELLQNFKNPRRNRRRR